jgi:hypothetical protein
MLVPYTGGPIVRCPLIHTSFWGPSWGDAAHTALANKINQFNQDFVASQAMNVLHQYGVLGGVYIGPTYLSWVPHVLTVSSYKSIIQSCINANAIPEPVNPAQQASVPILLVYLDEHTSINDPSTGRTLNFPGAADLGYHDSFTTTAGHPFIYAFTGYFSIDLITEVSSHEFSEMITDPLYNAWTPDHAFHEIGDYCEGNNDTITVGGRTWHIQKEWSDVDNVCRGTAPSPIPAIAGGPGGAALGAAAGAEARGRGPRPDSKPLPHERLLPLPPRHIGEDFKVTIKDDDLHTYHRRVFHPLTHEHLLPDFPAFLRQAADVIESVSSRASASPDAVSSAAGSEVVTSAAGPDGAGVAGGRGRVRAS